MRRLDGCHDGNLCCGNPLTLQLGPLLVLILLTHRPPLDAVPWPLLGVQSAIFPLLMVFMALSGGSSLGFIGIALAVACDETAPVDEVYSGGFVEWWMWHSGMAGVAL